MNLEILDLVNRTFILSSLQTAKGRSVCTNVQTDLPFVVQVFLLLRSLCEKSKLDAILSCYISNSFPAIDEHWIQANLSPDCSHKIR